MYLWYQRFRSFFFNCLFWLNRFPTPHFYLHTIIHSVKLIYADITVHECHRNITILHILRERPNKFFFLNEFWVQFFYLFFQPGFLQKNIYLSSFVGSHNKHRESPYTNITVPLPLTGTPPFSGDKSHRTCVQYMTLKEKIKGTIRSRPGLIGPILHLNCLYGH